MPDLNVILNAVTLVLVALGGYALVLLKATTQAAAKTSAEELAKAAVKQYQWQAELARELQKTRGVERQELRFQSYGALWQKLRPLAIYDETVINKKTVGDLATHLSDWYFSASGGLLLTPQARDFYFALQDLLRATSTFQEDWVADRSAVAEGDQEHMFRRVLETRSAAGAIGVLDYLETGLFEDWQNQAAGLAKKWREGIKAVSTTWEELDARQRFATLQQVGSILRTSLVNDLDSRVR